jgi:hypothetical protein
MTVVNYETGYPYADGIQRLAEMQPAAAWLRVSDQRTNSSRPYWGTAALRAVLTDSIRANLIIDSENAPAMVAVTTRRGTPVILIRTRRGEDLMTIARAIARLVKAHGGSLQTFDATKVAQRAIEATR